MGDSASGRCPTSPFVFHTATLLRCSGQLVCRMSFHLGLSDCFLLIIFRLCTFGKNTGYLRLCENILSDCGVCVLAMVRLCHHRLRHHPSKTSSCPQAPKRFSSLCSLSSAVWLWGQIPTFTLCPGVHHLTSLSLTLLSLTMGVLVPTASCGCYLN